MCECKLDQAPSMPQAVQADLALSQAEAGGDASPPLLGPFPAAEQPGWHANFSLASAPGAASCPLPLFKVEGAALCV